MRNPGLPLALLFILFIGPHCKKDSCSPNPAANEAAPIQAYAMANGMNITAHSSGLFYEIIDPGSGATATLNSKIVITYTGKLLNGTIFDQRINPNNTQTEGPESPWPLGQLIEGWKVGIPLIKKGGRIKLLVPSAMAYGCTGYGSIPGDSPLFFDIQLVDIQ